LQDCALVKVALEINLSGDICLMNYFEDKDVPLLFIIFNRVEETSRVFQEIRRLAPKKLFIAADGPRPDRLSERDDCNLTRQACSNIDWDCEVFTKFSDLNQGCKVAVSSAITWFFSHVESGIILEDDCLPSPAFFRFCREMLVRYQYDDRVMQISGSNYLGNKYSPEFDYYFSSINDIWGWATWRRAWKHFDLDMHGYQEFKKSGGVSRYLQDRAMSNWLTLYLDDALNDGATVWSSQWTYAMAKCNGLTIAPSKNLVYNIGFDDRGTHSSNKSWQLYNEFPVSDLKVINHPKQVKRDFFADKVRFSIIKKTDPRCFFYSRARTLIFRAYVAFKKTIINIFSLKK
jgi:hypothetical protein